MNFPIHSIPETQYLVESYALFCFTYDSFRDTLMGLGNIYIFFFFFSALYLHILMEQARDWTQGQDKYDLKRDKIHKVAQNSRVAYTSGICGDDTILKSVSICSDNTRVSNVSAMSTYLIFLWQVCFYKKNSQAIPYRVSFPLLLRGNTRHITKSTGWTKGSQWKEWQGWATGKGKDTLRSDGLSSEWVYQK